MFNRCDICAKNFYRSSFAELLRSNNHLLETDDKVKCEACLLVKISGLNLQNQLLTDENIARHQNLQRRPKIGFETFDKVLSEMFMKTFKIPTSYQQP